MLKKCVVWLALAAVLLGASPLPAVAQTIPDTKGVSIAAKGAVVLDASNGRVLFAQNANGRLPMASTTKIMTALLALEQPDLDEPFVVDPTAIRVEGTSMGLKEWDTVTLRALAHGMLLPSGNDAANAAAVRIAGSKDAFAGRMNERARELGLEDTHYVTRRGWMRMGITPPPTTWPSWRPMRWKTRTSGRSAARRAPRWSMAIPPMAGG